MPFPQGLFANLQPADNGMSFGGGGINYSTPVGDGQLASQLKANQLKMQWQDKLNQINLDAKTNGNWNINYIRHF